MMQELQLGLSTDDVTGDLTSQCRTARHSLQAVAAPVYDPLQIDAIPGSEQVSCPN